MNQRDKAILMGCVVLVAGTYYLKSLDDVKTNRELRAMADHARHTNNTLVTLTKLQVNANYGKKRLFRR